MSINLIAACAENRVMGRQGRLPWTLPEDLAWLEQWTQGKPVLLGRICYETWPRVHDNGRRPVVVTSTLPQTLRKDTSSTGGSPLIARDVNEGLALAQGLGEEVFVCGGEKIFEATLPLAQKLYLTLVHTSVEGDRYFPEWRQLAWRESYRRESSSGALRYTFLVLERA